LQVFLSQVLLAFCCSISFETPKQSVFILLLTSLFTGQLTMKYKTADIENAEEAERTSNENVVEARRRAKILPSEGVGMTKQEYQNLRNELTKSKLIAQGKGRGGMIAHAPTKSKLVRLDTDLCDVLEEKYIGKEDMTIGQAIWYLVNRDRDIREVETKHPEVANWLSDTAETRNVEYARRQFLEAKKAGKKIVRLELE